MAIYVEGGGDSTADKNALRIGMDVLLTSLKDRVRAKAWRWKLVFCGGRRAAYEKFINAREHAGSNDIVILLVDSEGPVTVDTKAAHLKQRQGDEGWDLTGVPEDHIHFMAQTMEAWIVADPEALATYYGQGFRTNALPARQNLEDEAKPNVAEKLKAATRDSKTKGEYHKIAHASQLLAKIDPTKVRARCPHAERFFTTLERLIG
ncbi:DUF4276 family protein [Azospirillum argentinense]|uniref:DUF4276 family protein n=1 Tax=Azospirillum argentinense TaxID=2970906 RepID=UPI0015865662|nr:DUF4276 family protein [Azospirillum argentinense]